MTIVASVPPTDHGWLGQVAAKAQEAADQWDDVEFRLVEAADADSQASQIETLINEQPDAIVVLPYDGEALTPVAEKAMEAGIPVINVDRLFATPEAARTTILGDNYGIGVKAAEFLAGTLDCEGNVVEIQGIAGISVTEDRSAGFADTIEELCGDGIKIVAQQPGDFNPDTGLEVMEAILQANDDIDAVYTHDDDMAEGVVAAIENAGREDEMILTGVGGSCAAFDQHRGGWPLRGDLPLQPDDGGLGREHGPADRPGPRHVRPLRARGSVGDHRASDRGHAGQRRATCGTSASTDAAQAVAPDPLKHRFRGSGAAGGPPAAPCGELLGSLSSSGHGLFGQVGGTVPLARLPDRLSTSVGFEFPHDRGDVSLHGRMSEMQRGGDLRVGSALGY